MLQFNQAGRHFTVTNGSRIAVIGGGPSGSFFSYFLLDMAQKIGQNIHVDMYESKHFLHPGPDDCNMCAGVISESLVQILATINLPSSIVQRGIDSYVMHMNGGNIRIETPLHEKRIATVHLGWNIVTGIRFLTKSEQSDPGGGLMQGVGRIFSDGELIVDQGRSGDSIYVIQTGQVEMFCEKQGKKVLLELLGEGDFFGEISSFDGKKCLASVRAVGEARVLTIDKNTFLREIHLDPSLTYHMLQTMTRRIQTLKAEVLRLKDKT